MVAYLVEIFPFTTRAKGLAMFQIFGRLSTIFNTFFSPSDFRNAGWKYYTAYIIWLLCEIIIVYFLFPETKGPTLEELTFRISLSYKAHDSFRRPGKEGFTGKDGQRGIPRECGPFGK